MALGFMVFLSFGQVLKSRNEIPREVLIALHCSYVFLFPTSYHRLLTHSYHEFAPGIVTTAEEGE